MSRTIDEKVVSLEFDNEKFEKNVKTSLSTIERLKQALKFDGATKGMEEVERASEKMNFDNVSSNLEKVTVKFDVLQTVAITAISNITNKIVDMGLKLIDSLSGFSMIQSGYQKMDELNASVQTLMNSTGKSVDEINHYLDRLMVFSDETSYGFTDMTSALSTMVASGGDIEKLIPMIEGMANATAYAGKSAAEFKRVIYNLNQSYSAGYLTLMDWKSVANVNVNSKALIETLIRYGEELGKIEKGTVTLGNFTETLKNKWADTEVMELAFGEAFASMTTAAHEMLEAGEVDNFTEAYKILSEDFDELSATAAKAAQEAKSFKEAIDATTDAVSSKWSQMFTNIFGDYTKAKKTWSQLAEDLYYIFAQPLDDINNNIIGPAFAGRWSQFEELINSTGLTMETFEDRFRDFAKSHGWDVERLIDKYGSFKNALSSGHIKSSYISKFFEYLSKSEATIDSATSRLEAFQKVFNDIWSGKYGNGEARIKALTDAGYDYATMQGLINKLAKEGHRAGYTLMAKDIEDLSDAQLKNIGFTEEQIEKFRELATEFGDSNSELSELIESLSKPTGQELLAKTIGNLTGIILNFQKTAKEAWEEVMDIDFANVIYNIVKAIADFTDKVRELTTDSQAIKTAFKILYSGLKAVLSVFNLIKTVVGQIARGAFSIFTKILEALNIQIPEFNANLTEGIDSLTEWISNNDFIFSALDRIGDAIANFIPRIKEWIDAFVQLPFIQKTIETFRDVLQDITNKELDFSKITDPVKDLRESIINGTFNPLESLGLGIMNIFDGLSQSIGKYTGNVKENLRQMLSPLKLTEDQWAKIGETFVKTGETALGLGTGYMFLTAFNKLADGLSVLVSPFKGFSDVAKSAMGSFNAVTTYIKSLERGTNINNILKLGIALGILVASLWALAKLGPLELLEAAAAMVVLTLCIKGLSAAMSSSGTADLKKSDLPRLLLSLAGSLLIFAIALKKIDGLKNGLRSLVYLGVALAGLVGAMWVLNTKANGIMFSDFVKPVLAFAVSLYLIAVSLKKLEKVHLTSSSVATLTILSGLILLLAKVSKGLTKSQGLQIVGIAGSLYIFAKILEKIGQVSFDDAYSGMIKLLPVVALIALIMKATKGVTGSSFTAASIIVAAALAVRLIGVAVEKLGLLDVPTLTKGGIAVGILFTVISAIGAGLSALLGSTNLLLFSFGKAAGIAAIMITACGSLYLMAGAIMVFKNMDADGLKQGLDAVTQLLVALGISVGIMGAASQGINYNTVSALGKMVAVIGVLSIAIIALSLLPDAGKLYGVMGGLTILLASLAGMIVIVSKFGFEMKTALKTFAIITAVLTLITGAIYILASFTKTDDALKVSEALSLLMISLSGSFLLIAAASNLAKFAMVDMVSLIKVFGTISAVVLAIGGLAAGIEALFGEGTLDKISFGATKIGETIGGFVGGILGGLGGGVIEGLTNTLPMVGQNLSDFVTNAERFFEFKLPDSFISTVNGLITLFEGLGASSVQTSLKNIQNSNKYMSSVKDFLAKYAESVVGFSNEIDKNGGINSGSVSAAANAGMMLAQLSANLPDSSLFGALFSGKESLAQFGTEMEAFAQSLVVVSSILKFGNFDSMSVSIATSAGTMFANLCNSLPNNGIISTLFTGTKSLADFGEDIVTFAASLVSVSGILKYGGFDATIVTSAANAGKMLAGLTASLPETESLKSFLAGGTQDIGTFGTQIAVFAGGLNSLCTTLESTNIDQGTVDKAAAAGDTLAVLAKKLPESTGLFGSGVGSLGSFGGDLTLFANGISSFFTNASLDNMPSKEDREEIISLANKLVDLVNQTSEIKSGSSSGFSSTIMGIGTSISDFFSSVVDSVSGSTDGSTSIWDMVKNYFATEGQKYEEIRTQLHDGSMELFESSISGWKDEGLQSEQQKTLNTIGNNTIEYLNVPGNDGVTLATKSENTAIDYLKGILKGIQNLDLHNSIFAAISDLGTSMVETLQKSIDSNSPSKETMKIGQYFDEGLVIGIRSMSDSVENSAYNAGISMLTGISRSMALADAVLDDAMNPVIAPVLDLSNIRNDAGQISGLLGADSSYNAAMSIGGYNWNSGIQNGAQMGQPIVMNNNFTLNGVGNIQDPTVLNTLADRLADKINTILGNAL